MRKPTGSILRELTPAELDLVAGGQGATVPQRSLAASLGSPRKARPPPGLSPSLELKPATLRLMAAPQVEIRPGMATAAPTVTAAVARSAATAHKLLPREGHPLPRLSQEGAMKILLLVGLLAIPLAAQALPLQSEAEVSAWMGYCEWDVMHNSRGVYMPQSHAEQVCRCGINKLKNWVQAHNATTIPPEVERDAGASCEHRIPRINNNA